MLVKSAQLKNPSTFTLPTIAVEIKNLAYECLEKKYLDKIIEEINNQL